MIGGSFGLTMIGGLLVVLGRRGRDPGRLASRRFGLSAMVAGLFLRVWAAHTLGRYYTRTLRVAPDQPVVRAGPYRFIRHPGYLADLALWIGFGLALGSRFLTVLIAGTMALAYSRRIDAEEALLLDRLGVAYRDYQRQSWRLLPPVY